jgi:hypothetical protein
MNFFIEIPLQTWERHGHYKLTKGRVCPKLIFANTLIFSNEQIKEEKSGTNHLSSSSEPFSLKLPFLSQWPISGR